MGSHAITPDPIAVELEYYKERNYVIHTRNELLEKDNRDAHNKIRDLQIQIARDAHPAGKAIEPPEDPPSKTGNPVFDKLVESAESKEDESGWRDRMTDEQRAEYDKFMEDDDD